MLKSALNHIRAIVFEARVGLRLFVNNLRSYSIGVRSLNEVLALFLPPSRRKQHLAWIDHANTPIPTDRYSREYHAWLLESYQLLGLNCDGIKDYDKWLSKVKESENHQDDNLNAWWPEKYYRWSDPRRRNKKW